MSSVEQTPVEIFSPEQLATNERRSKVADFLALDMNLARQVLNENTMQERSFNEFESRPYQVEAWDAIWQAREAGESKALIHLATGLGKTSVSVVDFAKFSKERKEQGLSKPRALFAVHQESILTQASERFHEMIPGITSSTFGTQREDLPNTDITFGTFQSLVKEIHRFPRGHFDYIVYDEAHHTKAKTFERVVEHFTPAFQLALTATPDRMDGKDISDLFGEPVYKKTLAEGMAEGYLATTEYVTLADEAMREALANGFEPKTMQDIQRLLELDMRNEEIIQVIQEKKEKIKAKEGIDIVKTIVYVDSIESADNVASLLDASSYHSGMSKTKQRSLLQQFRDGEIEDIVAKDMLNEGVDIPDVQLIVFLRSTQSKSIFEQQLGRGLRLSEGKTKVYVMDFVANVERIEFIKDLADNYKFNAFGNGGPSRGSSNSNNKTPSADRKDIESQFSFTEEVIDLLKKYQEIKGMQMNWTTWSNDTIVDLALKISPEKPLVTSDLEALGRARKFPSTATVIKRFGSIKAFQETCGFEVTKWQNLTNSEIVATALQISPDTPLSMSQINSLYDSGEFLSHRDVIKNFGSIVNFQKACGFEVRDNAGWSAFPDEDIIQLAKTLSPDTPVTGRRMNLLSSTNEFPSAGIIVERFGSITQFQRMCGFEVAERRDWSKSTIEEIVKLAIELKPDSPLESKEIQNLYDNGKFPSLLLIRQKFVSIAEFQKACGFEPARKSWSKYSPEDIVQIAKELSPDKALDDKTIAQLSSEGSFMSTGSIKNLFGSILKFQQACGYNLFLWSNATNEQLITAAKELSPDKPISQGMLRQLSTEGKFLNPTTLVSRFGSLTAFQQACGFDIKPKTMKK